MEVDSGHQLRHQREDCSAHQHRLPLLGRRLQPSERPRLGRRHQRLGEEALFLVVHRRQHHPALEEVARLLVLLHRLRCLGLLRQPSERPHRHRPVDSSGPPLLAPRLLLERQHRRDSEHLHLLLSVRPHRPLVVARPLDHPLPRHSLEHPHRRQPSAAVDLPLEPLHPQPHRLVLQLRHHLERPHRRRPCLEAPRPHPAVSLADSNKEGVVRARLPFKRPTNQTDRLR